MQLIMLIMNNHVAIYDLTYIDK